MRRSVLERTNCGLIQGSRVRKATHRHMSTVSIKTHLKRHQTTPNIPLSLLHQRHQRPQLHRQPFPGANILEPLGKRLDRRHTNVDHQRDIPQVSQSRSIRIVANTNDRSSQGRIFRRFLALFRLFLGKSCSSTRLVILPIFFLLIFVVSSSSTRSICRSRRHLHKYLYKVALLPFSLTDAVDFVEHDQCRFSFTRRVGLASRARGDGGANQRPVLRGRFDTLGESRGGAFVRGVDFDDVVAAVSGNHMGKCGFAQAGWAADQ